MKHFLSFLFICALLCGPTVSAKNICKEKEMIGRLKVCEDAKINGNLTVGDIDKTTTFQGRVVHAIGGTYTINTQGTGDFPTIQEGINFASSGLKPNSNVTLIIENGTYNESLFIDTSYSEPTLDPDVTPLTGRGLRLIGDVRPISGMSYMLGGQIRTAAQYTLNDGSVNSLGVLGSNVTSITSAPSGLNNVLTVTTSGAIQPNFLACGIQNGDTIIMTDSNGNVQERTVVSAFSNTVTYGGSPVAITGNGATLTFCPNVHVIAANPGAICYIADNSVETIGIWFSTNDETFYPVVASNHGILFCGQCLFDDRGGQMAMTLTAYNSGRVYALLADGTLLPHNTCIGGGLAALELDADGFIAAGHWYAMQTQPAGLDCVFLSATAQMSLVSLQMNGAGTANGLNMSGGGQGQVSAFTLAQNCNQGIFCDRNVRAVFAGSVVIRNSSIGLSGRAGKMVLRVPLTITNCPKGISWDLGSRFDSNSTVTIDTSSIVGIELLRSSTFNSANPVTFIATATEFTYTAGSMIQNGSNDSRTAMRLPGPFANDAAAAAGGVPLFGEYLLTGAPVVIAVRTS